MLKKLAATIALAGMAGYAGIAAADPAVVPPADNNNAINCSANVEPVDVDEKNLGQTLKTVRESDPDFNLGQFKQTLDGEGQPGDFLRECLHNNPS